MIATEYERMLGQSADLVNVEVGILRAIITQASDRLHDATGGKSEIIFEVISILDNAADKARNLACEMISERAARASANAADFASELGQRD